MKKRKQKSVTAMAEAFVWKFGSAPKSREWEFMIYAFLKGYASAKRRMDRSNNAICSTELSHNTQNAG